MNYDEIEPILNRLEVRIAALEAIPRPTIEEIARQVLDTPITTVCSASTGTMERVTTNLGGVVGYTLDTDAQQYQPTFLECGVCRSKPGTPLLCESCVKNRDTIYRLRQALETVNGLARQWKLNYDAVKEQRDKVPHPAYTVAAEWKRKHDEQKQRADANQAAADTLERLRNGEAVEGRILRDASAGTACEEHARLSAKAEAERDKWRQKAQANQAAADTLARLRGGQIVDDYYLWKSDVGLGPLRAERDALAARVAERDQTIAAQDLHRQDLERRLTDMKQRVPRGTVNGEKWVGVTESELSDLRRDAERWRWTRDNERWIGHDFERHVDAAIAAAKEAKG